MLVRTVGQLLAHDFQSITVVIGHRHEQIEAALAPFGDRVRCVLNPTYATDTNIGSLLRGLGDSDEPALIVEADIAFDDAAVAALAQDVPWSGLRLVHQRLLPRLPARRLPARRPGRLADRSALRRRKPSRVRGYRKLLGVVFAGPAAMPRFHRRLREAAARTTAQYYMMPWCEHLAELPARAVDLGHCRTATFNTPDEYARCLALFASEPATAHACPALVS
jgi:hypothetical protein